MGKEGGTALSFVGAIISIWYPYIGIPLMMGGGIITQQALKKEAMARMRSAMTGLRGNTRTTERPIPVIYGRQRVGGNVLWMSTEGKGPNDANPPRNKLFAVYGISEGPIDGYEEMFFNDVKVWDARSGQLKTQFYNMFYPEFRTGTNSQAPFSHVATYHNLYDIASETFPLTAVALVEFFYSPDVYQAIPNVSWTIRGKQVPDWTDAASPGIMKWTQSGPLQTADLLTNKQYGMGISSENLSVPDVTSAHAYATAPISPGSRHTVEIVDMSAQRPKYYERGFNIPSYGTEGALTPEDWSTVSTLYSLTLDMVPIKPGSLTFNGAVGSKYMDSPRSGSISEFGRMLTDPAGVQVGSINYLVGACVIDKPANYGGDENQDPIKAMGWVAKWYADWEFSYRTKYQNVARSMYVVSTPETLVETGTVTSNIINLRSSQGGTGTFDYVTGELNAQFGAHEWYDNQPVEVHYRVSTRARFSTNYPLFDPEKVMDAVKNIERHYRGFLVYADGKYGIKTDKPEGSVYSFDDDNIIAGTFRMHQPSIKEIPTKVTLKYLDALNNFTPAEASFDVRSVDAGMEIEHVLDMPGVTARDEAMASAYSYANLANLVNFIEFETNHNALGVEAGDVVDVTHPSAAWVGKLFRVLGISFAKDDKLAISAMEHDPTAYVDDWIQGPMVSRNPSFFPKRSYWPPNVSSATLSEYSRTLSDGTVVPVLKYQIMAVDSANLSVDHWNIYYSNLTRGQQVQLGYSGVNTTGYLSPVEPGWNVVNIHAVSQFDNESAKVWTGSVNVLGGPEHEWQNWRLDRVGGNDLLVNSGVDACEAIQIGTNRFFVAWYAASKMMEVNLLSGSQVSTRYQFSVASPEASLKPYTAENSGGCLSVIYYAYSGAGLAFNPWAYTFTASLTVVQSPTAILVNSNFGDMSFVTNSAKMIFGFIRARWAPNTMTAQWFSMSCNFAISARTPICNVASYIHPAGGGFDSGISATRTNSGIVFLLSGLSAGEDYRGYRWAWNDDMTTCVYSAALTFTNSGDFTNISVDGIPVARIAGVDIRNVFLVHHQWMVNTLSYSYGTFVQRVDARSSTNQARKVNVYTEDQAVGNYHPLYGVSMGKPAVSESELMTFYQWPVPTKAINADVFHYWRIESVVAGDYMSWI